MALFRYIDGVELAQKLRCLGYNITRQTGSHIRLTTNENGEHHETIPAHKPRKIGTLNAILRNIANHHKLSREELLIKLNL
ncbi:MAG: type II toxin-antitoxin system HicA family toxin [Spirochaetes bacterium]|nr:type II toxin-antitoxin system HicA family toxin [Spirochaetota bacterium]